MKRISNLLFLSVVALMIIFSSCSKKNENKPHLTGRKISFVALGTNFTKELNEKLYTAVMDGKIMAYRYDSLTPTCLFKAEEISRLSTLEENIQYAPDTASPDILIDTVIKQVFKTTDIVGYSIAEKWIPDSKNNKISGEIFAFAINWKPKIAGFEIPECPLFWVDYKDVRNLLSKGQVEELDKTIYNSMIEKLSDF